MTEATTGAALTKRPAGRPTQAAARYGFLAFCLAVAVVDVLLLYRITASSSSDAETYVVAGLHTGLATVYAWVWVTAVLMWTSRDNLLSMLDDALPRRATTSYPSSGLSPVVLAAVYAGALLGSAAIAVARGGLGVADAAEALGIVLFLHGFGVLAGAILAGLVSYPVLLIVRAFQLRPTAAGKDVRRARQGMLSLGGLLLLVLPTSVCLTLAYESITSDADPRPGFGGEFDARPLFGVVPDGVTILSPELLWTGRILLFAIVLLLVSYLTTLGSVRAALTPGRRRKAEETSLFEVEERGA